MIGEVLVWEGGEHNFWLGIGELRALQQSTGVGPLFLLGRITGSQWFVDDLTEVIRLGLIGGGMQPAEAKRAIDKVFIDNPSMLYRHVLLAMRVLKNSVMGYGEHDPVGETEAATMSSETL